MKLFINTSHKDKVVISLDGEKYETDAKKEKAQKLLAFIHETLTKKGLSARDIIEIKVHTGPGSFTGLRVGVSVSQALSYSLGIPVNGRQPTDGEVIEIQYDS